MINLYDLIGCSKQSIADLNNFHSKAFSDVEFLTDPQKGVSLALKNNKVDYIILYGPGHPKINPCQQLPYGLGWTQTNSQIVLKLGEPHQKLHCGSNGIELTYTPLGLSLEFQNPSWEDSQNPLKSVILFATEMPNPFNHSPETKFCAFCFKPAYYRCSRCKLFNYCSKTCQASHWFTHKNHCS